MNLRGTPHSQFPILCGLLISLIAAGPTVAQAPPEAALAFHEYTAPIEAQLARQHGTPAAFLTIDAREEARLCRGELIVEQLSPAVQPAGALLHHWRGTAFAPGATAAQFEQILRDFRAYPRRFAPQVVEARSLPLRSNAMQATIRVRQKHVITVVLDTSFDVNFGRLDLEDGYSTSRSTRIYEIDASGTDHERVLALAEEHGFLWRLNTYWTYQQRDGGLYLRIESVSLTRAIPGGLGWALRPYVTSVPRESLEFTLRSATNALHK